MLFTPPKGSRAFLIPALAALVFLAVLAGAVFPDGSRADQRTVRLYFPRADARGLGVEIRTLETGVGGEAARALLAALAGGPAGDAAESLTPVFPPGSSWRQAFVDRDRTAYVDLAAGRPAAGATMERLRIWAMVNTLCLNLEEVGAVKILIGGDEAETWSGHVDLSRPLVADPSLAE